MRRHSTYPHAYVAPDFQLRAAESQLVPVDVAMRTSHFEGSARRARRMPEHQVRGVSGSSAQGDQIHIFDLAGGMDSSNLKPVRISGDGKTSDDRIVEAALRNALIVQKFYTDVFGRDSITGDGMPLEICVHYGDRLNNALWDGAQFLFGDGDGRIYLPFAQSLEVVAHELSHAMIDSTSGLAYSGESGALNESFADVMAAMVVQREADVTVEQASWVMGADVLNPALGLAGIRSFKTAPVFQNHPNLKSDTQPKHYDDYVEDPDEDWMVHANAGIPNHAFYLSATRLGGKAWEVAGQIWFEAFVKLVPTADFVAAAQKTIWTAEAFQNPEAAEAFREAWAAVGIKIEG